MAHDPQKMADLVEAARKRPISKDELQKQREAFAFGNLPHNTRTTRDEVRRAVELMEGAA